MTRESSTFYNNINVKSNKEGKFTPSFISSDSDDSLNYSDASIDKRWGSDEYTDAVEIGAGYAFNNCKSVAHSSVSQKYLDNDGLTSIHYSILFKRFEIFEYLIKNDEYFTTLPLV